MSGCRWFHDRSGGDRGGVVQSSRRTALSVLTQYMAEHVEPVVETEMTAESMGRDADNPEHWRLADGLPYGYIVDRPDSETDPPELELIARVVGKPMRCDISLHILVSNLAGRPVLTQLAQRVAEQTEGGVFVKFQASPSTGLLSYLENAGRCIPVDDYAYLDAPAMAAWHAHPNFYVIK